MAFSRRLPSVLCAVAGVVGLVLAGTAVPAAAAPPAGHGGPGGGGGGGSHGGGPGGGGTGGGTGTTTPAAGNDVSYPQCGTTLPSTPAFGIVGVNGGLANDLNPCLGPDSSYTQSELYWAVTQSTGTVTPPQPTASLYVNTADPGNFYGKTEITDWPTSGMAGTAYGACTTVTVTERHRTYTVGANSPACAWLYGYNKAAQDVTWLEGAARAIDAQTGQATVSTSASSYPWWLDVETGNTWQSGATGIAMNVADLRGMVAALKAATAQVGVYSTASQWSQIAGTTTSTSGSLYGLPDWIPGATTLTGATTNCGQSSFTGGTVVLTQWTGTVDHDHAC